MRYKVAILVFFIVGLLWMGSDLCAQDQVDKALEFYVDRAASVYESRNPFERGAIFAYTATTVRQNLDRDSEVTDIDSVITRFYYSFGELDSTVTLVEETGDVGPVDFTIPNVMARDYVFNFYPNDVGGEDLAIGFDTRTFEAKEPIGFAVIDRNLYYYRALHMSYPYKQGFDRYSRSIVTTVVDGLVFPRELTVMAGIRGILGNEYYRQITTLTDFYVDRQ